MFLTIMVIGLVGLVMMALPAMGGHHLPSGHGHGIGHGIGHQLGPAASHGGGVGAAPGHAPAHAAAHAPGSLIVAAATASASRRLIPSPRALFSVSALYGAFGNALVHAGHLSSRTAALTAIAPALLVEWSLVRPVWNLMFRFKAAASSPLEELILAEAQAVVPFRNGQGLISTVRDGRRVQLHARLCDEQIALPVAVGQRMRIEDIDARRERVTVSVLDDPETLDKPG